MNKAELLNLINTMDDTEEVDEVLAATDLFKKRLSLENFKNLVGTDKEFKSFFDSEKDKHSAKAIETFKNNSLEKLVQAELLKKNPNKTEDQLRIEELELKFANAEKAKARAEMQSKFKDTLNEKKIPSNLLNFILAEDEETTLANITIFEDIINKSVANGVETKLRGGSYTPPKSQVPGGAITKEQFAKMGYAEKVKIFDENPELYEQLKK